MPLRRTLVSMSALVLAACGGSTANEPSAGAALTNAPSETNASSGGTAEPQPAVPDGGPSAATADASATTSGSSAINVSGRAPDDNTIDVGGSSDLPSNIPSSMQPYARVIETAVAPIRAALGECARGSGRSARRMYRVTVGRDGQLSPRPPQTAVFPASVLTCIDGVIRGTTANPPPPMMIPYDVYFDVPR